MRGRLRAWPPRSMREPRPSPSRPHAGSSRLPPRSQSAGNRRRYSERRVLSPRWEAWANTARRSGRALRPLLRAFLARADRIVAVSEGVAADVRTSLAARAVPVDVVANPVIDLSLFDDASRPPPDPWLGAPR